MHSNLLARKGFLLINQFHQLPNSAVNNKNKLYSGHTVCQCPLGLKWPLRFNLTTAGKHVCYFSIISCNVFPSWQGDRGYNFWSGGESTRQVVPIACCQHAVITLVSSQYSYRVPCPSSTPG